MNLVISPGLIKGSLFRRTPNAHALSNLRLPEEDARRGLLLSVLIEGESLSHDVFPLAYRARLPFE